MASRSIGTLTIDLVTKTGLFEQGMDKAARTAQKRMGDIAKSGAIVGTAIGGALAGLGAVIVRNTMQAEAELAQLDAILKSTGEAAGLTRDQLIQMSETLSSRSTFSSGEIIEAQTRLLSYSGVLGENIPRAMQAIIDQSARLGISVQQSAETIGRALESPSKAAAALAQQGFGAAFTKEVRGTIDALVAAGREGEAQIMILEILEESYAGAAEAARNTFGGSLQALRNTLNDLLTGDSSSLTGMTKSVNDLNDSLNDPGIRKGFQDIIGLGFDAAGALTKVAGAAFSLREAMQGVTSQSVAFGRGIRGALGLNGGEIRAAINDYQNAARSIDQALGFGPDNPFASVQGGARVRAASPAIDRSTLIDPEIQKRIDDINKQAQAYGKSATELAKLNRERDLATASTKAEEAAINAAYDALERGIRASEASKEAKKSVEDQRREAERLQSAYESLRDSMAERIALFYSEGEAARVSYDLQYGSLKALAEPLKENLRLAAEQYDAMVKRREEDETRLRLAEEETNRINRALDMGRAVLEDLEFEIELMGMSNLERQKAIALWGLEAEAVERYGEAIGKAIEQRQLIEEQIELADGFRSAFTNAFEDIASGTKSVSDVFRDMLQDIADMITRFAAQKLVEQLFGAQGSTQSGSQGGWIQALVSIFAGGRANGGWIRPGQVAEVNERGMEMATVGGRDYLLTGGQPVKITPNHMMGGGVSLTVNNAFSEPTSTKTQTQIAARIAYEQRRAARFGA